MKALEERLGSLLTKSEPGSRYSLLGQTLGAFGDPAWVTQQQLDSQKDTVCRTRTSSAQWRQKCKE